MLKSTPSIELKLWLLEATAILVSAVAPSNVFLSILTTLDGIETEVNALALENTKLGREITPSGMVIDVSAVTSKADAPMVVRPTGREIDTNEVAFENARSPILVTLDGKEIEVNPTVP